MKEPNQTSGIYSGQYVEWRSNGPYIQCKCGFMSDLCGHVCSQYPLTGVKI